MKFIPLASARGLKFNEPVFVQIDNSPAPVVGRLIKKEQTASGVIHTFEVAAFADAWHAEGRTIIQLDKQPQVSLVPFTTTAATHVCIPKPS